MDEQEKRQEYTTKILSSYERAPWGKPMEERVRAVMAIEDGMTYRKAAELFGIGTGHLQRYCKLCGVKSKRTKLTKAQLCEVVEDIKSGLQRSAIADRWGLSERRVYRIGLEAGIKNGGK